MKLEDQMVECLCRCGAFVPIGGPTICGACEVGDAVREFEEQRSEEAHAKYEARLVKSERCFRMFTILTRGNSVIIECPATRLARTLFTNEARVLAAKIVEASDYIDSLKSPYVDGAQ